jgi:DNA-binding transcriptional MerR regulator
MKAKPEKQDLMLGEILKQTGLSKRELQALDQLGLFNRQAQTSNGIRRYDLQSMMLIEQFEFYTAHGLPMEAVREFLADPGLQDQGAALDAQAMLLYTRLDALQTQMMAVQAAQELRQAGKDAPWGALTRLLRKDLAGKLNFWEEFQSESLTDGLNHYASFETLWDLYQQWKGLLIRGAFFRNLGILPEEQVGKRLGLDYLNWKRAVAAEEPGLAETFSNLQETQSWLKDELFKGLAAYLEQLESGL